MINATQPARGRPRYGTGDERAAFGGIDKSALRDAADPIDYDAIQRSPEFRALRRRISLFVLPMTVLFLAWYIGYVLLAAYDHDFMAQRLVGEINVGLVMGLGQFVTTLVIATLYVRFARKRVDPKVDEIHQAAHSKGR